jgi:type II secretory pathway predicted ATPase ExeA
MVETHFGFKCRPFIDSLDTAAYYPATTHELALAGLQSALRHEDSLALLTGDPGTGKTLVTRLLIERLGAETTTIFLSNSRVPDRAGLLQAILFDAAQPYQGLVEQELRLAVTDYLLGRFRDRSRTVLIADEAQHLLPDLLEELRLLANLEGAQGKAVQVVLVAQPEIVATFWRPELRGLRQRLACRFHLDPLGPEESADYLVHQVRRAGVRPEAVFSDEALEVLAQGTRGIPRVLNQAAQQALSLAHRADVRFVDAEVALGALELLNLEPQAESEATGPSADDLGYASTEARPSSLKRAPEDNGKQSLAAPSSPRENGNRPPPRYGSKPGQA